MLVERGQVEEGHRQATAEGEDRRREGGAAAEDRLLPSWAAVAVVEDLLPSWAAAVVAGLR